MLRADVEIERPALRVIAALEVAAGEVVAVVGPNGAGKSTLLAALAGLVPVAAGRVELDGTVLEDAARTVRLAPERRRVGVVFQEDRLFPHLSARQNVAFPLRVRGTSRRAATAAADRWLDRVGLGHLGGIRPGALSGGQARRVALARTLAGEPRVLLLDEPLTSLDAAARPALRRELRLHLDTFAGPCLLVTHEPVEAIALADRLVVLEHGRVVQSGTVAEVTRRPRSPWAARLAGVNLYRGEAAAGLIQLDGGGELRAVGGAAGSVYAVVHPRAVALHRRRPEGTPRNRWTGRVGALEEGGDRVRVEVVGAPTIVAEVTPAAVSDLGLGRGGEVWVTVKASEIEVYEA